MTHRLRRWLALFLLLGAGISGWQTFQRLTGAELGVDFAEQHYQLLLPQMLAFAWLLPLVAWGAFGSLADLPAPQRVLAVCTRMLLIALLMLALSRPVRVADTSRVSAVFLVDVSSSVTDADIAEAQSLVDKAWAERGDNDLQLVTFAVRPRWVRPRPAERPALTVARHGGKGASEGTDIQSALQLAYGLFPGRHIRRVVIVSDGGQTEGELLAECARARKLGVRVYYHPLLSGAPREVAVRELIVPDGVQVGTPFAVRAKLFATTPTEVKARLYQDEILNGLDGIRQLKLSPGESEVEFRSLVRLPGRVTYRIQLEPGGADRFSANNHFSTTVDVPGPPRLLYVDSDLRGARYLEHALRSSQYEVDVRGPLAMPRDARELNRYDFFIFSNVAADMLSAQQMALVERYVRDEGGGFLMIGGEDSFGLGGYHGTRLEKLLPLRMETDRRRDEHSLGLALVIDRSGSMAGQKIELAKDAAMAAAELLGPEDHVGVVGFSGEPERVVPMQSARNRLKIANSIGRLSAEGGTAILPALDMAYQDLSITRARIKHVILLTDGRTEESGFDQLVQSMRAEDITLSTVGLGADVNRALLQHAASLGGGRAYFTDNPHSIPRIFTRETTTVARSSAVEEFFQPSVVNRAGFLRGIDMGRAPLLHGYVATQPKPSPAQVILQSEDGDPILARWRVGLGWALAWTSDAKNRWAVEWVRWPHFAPFWAQLVREHMRQSRERDLKMNARMTGNTVQVVVDAVGRDDRFLNGLESRLTVEGPMDPSGQAAAQTTDHTLRQTAPGRYEARFPIHRYGSFLLRATHLRGDELLATSHAELSNPYPREYATLQPDEQILGRAARLTGGEARPGPQRIFEPLGQTVQSREPLWAHLVWAALGLFLLDLLLRRIRLFDRGPLR